MNHLKQWMANATPQEKMKLARLMGMSRGALSVAAGAYRAKGKLDMAPDKARKMEDATVKLAREGLPALQRESLCRACGRCDLAKAARGG